MSFQSSAKKDFFNTIDSVADMLNERLPPNGVRSNVVE